MAIAKLETNLGIIGALGDQPQIDDGLTTQQFKDKFDEGPKAIQDYLNDTIAPAIDAINAGAIIMSAEQPDTTPCLWIDISDG